MTTLKTYRAPTMAQALAEVKKDLGTQAVIVNTRSVKAGGWAGLGAKSIVEITATPASAPRPVVQVRKPATPPPPPVPRPGLGTPVAASETWQPLEFSPFPARPVLAPEPPPAPRSKVLEAPAPKAEPSRPAERAAVSSAPSEPGAEQKAAPVGPAAVPIAPVSKVTPAAPSPGPMRLATRVSFAPESGAARAALEDELASIKRMMGQVLQFSRRAAARGDAAGIPPVGGASAPVQEVYAELLDSAMCPEIADRLLAGVQARLDPVELDDPELVRRSVHRLLAELIPVVRAPSKPGRQADGRPLTIALVGPTGVGKTTSIAKLAAVYKLRHGKRVGLITTDTYRIAAVEQLRTYARIIGLPVQVAADPQDTAEAMREMKDLDVVLVDTAGRSPSDRARLDELTALVRAARPHETHLVLAATASEAVLMRAVERFRPLEPDRLILTKLDEAVQLGAIAAVPGRAGLPLSHVCVGQEVPDDIELANADRLARRIAPAAANATTTEEPPGV